MRQLSKIVIFLPLLFFYSTFSSAAQITLPDRQWALLTVPANADNQTIESLFADDLPIESLGSLWTIFGYDQENQIYVAPGKSDSLNQGEGFWIIQITGGSVTIDVPETLAPGDLTTSNACSSPDGCFVTSLPTSDNNISWAISGAPFAQPTTVGDIRLHSSDQACVNGCSLGDAIAGGFLYGNQWVYDSGASTYRPLIELSELKPWQAFWISTDKAQPSTELSLLFPSPIDAEPPNQTEPFQFWRNSVQPQLAEQCGNCHLGKRFGFASLDQQGTAFTDQETLSNYTTFLPLISLDSPNQSRLLVKTLAQQDERSLTHGGGSLLVESDDLYQTILRWILLEKNLRCPNCGLTAEKAYIAYVDQPSINWALARTPTRNDIPFRSGARLMLQEIDPGSLQPTSEVIDFLPQSFCASDGLCDIGRIASNYKGDELVFECRLPANADNQHPLDLSWNLCIAGISENGRAINPRFLKSENQRHQGWTVARTDAYGLKDARGLPSRGRYDLHYRMRQMDDTFPVYSPDDERIIFSSRSADPRTGVIATRTYHGAEFTNNIISTDRNGNDAKTIYLNEGGLADSPFFLRNGNIAMHVWNLERMDRHLYVQSTADGMMEMPVLFGRTQGRNMWGPLTQLANGTLMGTTGHRRGSVKLFVPFHTDHTIGLGLDSEFPGFKILDPEIVAEMDESFKIALIDQNGTVETLLNPVAGRSLSNPVFVGKRWAPIVQDVVTDESQNSAELHIADFPLWLSFREQQAQSRKRFVEEKLDNIVSVRVLVKKLGANVCTNDGKTYRRSTYDTYDHPTHLGANNATGYDHLFVPQDQGGDGFGNVPLEADNSIRLRLPSGVPLLLQGIDKNGHMVSQHSRVFAMPPGHKVNTSVRRSQHDAQCASCHGTVTGNDFPPFSSTAFLPAIMDFQTQATVAVDLVSVPRVGINFLNLLRPKLDAACVSCHSGDQPAAFLNLESNYSETANAPHMHWAYALQTDATSGSGEGYANYLDALPANLIVRGHNWSPAREFVIREGDAYLSNYVDATNPTAPIANFAPWDPGYQMLMISQAETDGDYRYMTDWQYQTQFGRGGDWSKSSFLLEVLTGQDLDPRNSFSGLDHTGMMDEFEIRNIMALIDNGFPYASECDSTLVIDGPNTGLPWGDTKPTFVSQSQ